MAPEWDSSEDPTPSVRSFEAWYRAAHPRLLAALVVTVGDVDVARDATSEAFTRALQHWSRVHLMESPEAWVHRVAINVVRRSRRRQVLEERLLRRQRWEPRPPPQVAPEVWEALASVGPTRPVVVASGEIEGHEWRLQAYEHDATQCLDLLEGGRACFDVPTQRAVGVAVDLKVSEDATGTARTSPAAVYGPVRRDVAHVAIVLASGQVIEVTPVGQDAGFAVNFYVAHAPTDLPPFSELSQVIAYDAAGHELDHLEPHCAPDLGGRPAPLAIEIRAVGPCV